MNNLQRRPEIHLFAARYKENQADFDGVRQSLNIACQVSPELVEPIVRLANFERRQVEKTLETIFTLFPFHFLSGTLE